MKMHTFEIESEMQADADSVWSEVTTMRAVNRELAPLAYMTCPSTWDKLPISEWPTGKPLFNSTILFLRLLPVDRHAFQLSDSGERFFLEESTSWMNRVWRHRRSVAVASANLTILRDEVSFRSRLPLVGAMMLPIYRLIFRNRHRRLLARFGAA